MIRLVAARPAATRRRAAAWPARGIVALGLFFGAACDAFLPGPTGSPGPLGGAIPAPACGGLRVAIEQALPCDRLAALAIGAIQDRAPQHLARGVTSITITLADCPRGAVPPQVECGTEPFAQLATVAFGPAVAEGQLEPSLTVALQPVTGRVMGIINPLIL